MQDFSILKDRKFDSPQWQGYGITREWNGKNEKTEEEEEILFSSGVLHSKNSVSLNVSFFLTSQHMST